jgi:heme/copper-type cytochrome/quinol oxidase subunit 2
MPIRTQIFSRVARRLSPAALVSGLLAAPSPALAQNAIDVMLKNHHFTPAEIHVPAGKAVTLNVKNADEAAEEFESHALKIEKVIAAGTTGSVRLRPLDPGSYPFVGEYHEDTAKGVIIAE